jgi:hypothetical protein
MFRGAGHHSGSPCLGHGKPWQHMPWPWQHMLWPWQQRVKTLNLQFKYPIITARSILKARNVTSKRKIKKLIMSEFILKYCFNFLISQNINKLFEKLRYIIRISSYILRKKICKTQK